MLQLPAEGDADGAAAGEPGAFPALFFWQREGLTSEQGHRSGGAWPWQSFHVRSAGCFVATAGVPHFASFAHSEILIFFPLDI
jgi:hypothetical protein